MVDHSRDMRAALIYKTHGAVELRPIYVPKLPFLFDGSLNANGSTARFPMCRLYFAPVLITRPTKTFGPCVGSGGSLLVSKCSHRTRSPKPFLRPRALQKQ